MLTVGLGRGARWTEEVSRAACAHQTAPTSPGRDRCAARMERRTKTNAPCWKQNAKATPTWTCSTRGSARVSTYYFKSAPCQWDSTFLKAACAKNPALLFVFSSSSSSSHISCRFSPNLPLSLSRQKRAVTSCAPAAPHASWTRRTTHIVWRVIGFAPRWRRLSSTCVETTGSSMPARVTWEELPVSSADPLEWHTRENASVSLQRETWECEARLCESASSYSLWILFDCSFFLASSAAIHSSFLPTFHWGGGLRERECLVVACVCSRNDRHLIISWCWQHYPIWEKGKGRRRETGERWGPWRHASS